MAWLCSYSAMAKRDAFPDSATDAAQQLRAAGVRVTAARQRVLAALLVADQPLCHAELETLLAAGAAPALDRVTLYRVLDALVGSDLAVRSLDDRGVFRFASAMVSRQHAGHAHFRCTGCGTVFCLDAPAPRAPALPHGFRAAEVELDVRGTCGHCTRRGAGR